MTRLKILIYLRMRWKYRVSDIPFCSMGLHLDCGLLPMIMGFRLLQTRFHYLKKRSLPMSAFGEMNNCQPRTGW